MNELIKITQNEKGEQLVSARELYNFLNATERFQSWFERLLQFGFVEGEDFVGCKEFNTLAKRELQNYILKINMAKEISMLQRNEKGRQARLYFIECEKQLQERTPKLPTTYKEALYSLLAEVEKNEKLVLENNTKNEIIEINKPKVGFAETIEKAKSDVLFRDMAKIIGNEGINMGQNKLYTWCREKGLILKKGTMPTQKAISQKLMSISVNVFDDYESVITKITGKGQIWILDKIKKEIIEEKDKPRTIGQILNSLQKQFQENDEIMADNLGYTVFLLQSIKKETSHMPSDMLYRLAKTYPLTKEEKQEIIDAQGREVNE